MKRRTFLATTAAAAAGTQLIGGVPLRAFTPVELMNTIAF
jgi:TAT (twin-arginine translocation) pathway signal sequence